MKALIWTYLVSSLFLLALLSVISYGYGAGYIYVYWHDWQIQTNVWIAGFAVITCGLILQLLWTAVKRYRTREQRKLKTIFDFKTLHY